MVAKVDSITWDITSVLLANTKVNKTKNASLSSLADNAAPTHLTGIPSVAAKQARMPLAEG